VVEAQSGDRGVVDHPERLLTADERVEVAATRSGVVVEIAPRALGEAVVSLGGGRRLMHQPIDPGVGFELRVATGDTVRAGDLLGVVHARDGEGVRMGREALLASVRLGEVGTPVTVRPLVSHRIAGPVG
jgi:pyrimidine-nucleoside phosphorylase